MGCLAFVAGMYVLIPELIERGSAFLYRVNPPKAESQNDNDWGSEIVKNSELEGTEDDRN